MARNHSGLGYRVKRSRVGKQLKSHVRLLCVAGVVSVAVILTVIWGIIWGEKAQASAEARYEASLAEAAREAATPDWFPAHPAPINASYLGRPATLDTAIADIALLRESGTSAISLPLYADGTPYYVSSIAQAMGRQASDATDVTLSRLFAAALADGGYVAATFTCSWQGEADAAMGHVMRAYEAALIAEIAESGANEVLLLGLSADQGTQDEAILFLREIRQACPDAVIGVAVPTSALLADTGVETARALLTYADHLALDLSDATAHILSEVGEDGEPVRKTATVADTLDLLAPTIARYQMRLLLPTAMIEHLATLEEAGYTDWQIIR